MHNLSNEHQINQGDKPAHDIMLRRFKTSSYMHGLKSPQRSEGIIVKASSVVVIIVVVQWLGFCFVLLVRAEKNSWYIAPVSMACFRYRWSPVTAESSGMLWGQRQHMRHSALFRGVETFYNLALKTIASLIGHHWLIPHFWSEERMWLDRSKGSA